MVEMGEGKPISAARSAETRNMSRGQRVKSQEELAKQKTQQVQGPKAGGNLGCLQFEKFGWRENREQQGGEHEVSLQRWASANPQEVCNLVTEFERAPRLTTAEGPKGF